MTVANASSRLAMMVEIKVALMSSRQQLLIRLPAMLALIDLEEEEGGGETLLSLGLRWMVRHNAGPIYFLGGWGWGPRSVPPALHAAIHSESMLYGHHAKFDVQGPDRAGRLDMAIPVLRWDELESAIEAMGLAIRRVRSVIDVGLEDVPR